MMSCSRPLMGAGPMAKSPTKTGNEPAYKKKRKGVHLAVFENQSDNATFFKATLQRVYKKDGKFETTNSLSRDDIPTAVMLLNDAYSWILDAESKQNGTEE